MIKTVKLSEATVDQLQRCAKFLGLDETRSKKLRQLLEKNDLLPGERNEIVKKILERGYDRVNVSNPHFIMPVRVVR